MTTYSSYVCPKCGWEPPEFEGTFKTYKGKKYPIFSNDRKYYNGSYDMHDWDETYFCPKCKEEFTFANGAV